MIKDIPTRYDPKQFEDSIYDYWEKKGFFHADADNSKKPYSIVIPPPNITGILHMGHALNNAIQDILIRFKRMQGYQAEWLPGTDHAGIATQNVVEKKLMKEGKRRHDLGRERFLEEVWSWQKEYGSTIIKQLKKLGSSCDWQRTRFTMDEGLSNAVLEVFVELYRKGLIYQGDYIINWCPRCQTALSDEEAQHKEVEGALYYVKYPIKKTTDHRPQTTDGSTVHSPQSTDKSKSVDRRPSTEDYIIVATTRPETMLGDVAVAVNPKDKRFKHLKGKTVVLPLLGREIPVIFDEAVDLKFGTGALKITPAHDPVDFQIGNKHKLSPINIMNADATINEGGAEYNGMDRFEAREAIVEDLKESDLFIKQEKHVHAVGHCYRCHTMVEPRLSRQWFVRMKPLAEPAIDAVKKKKIKFYPARWTKVYLNWMENIKDWCISRQIWWGHRLPVYYCKNCIKQADGSTVGNRQSTKDSVDHGLWTVDKKGIIVSKVRPEKCPDCGSGDIVQDPDVLDTWFSSWLWPFSTFGWPADTPELKYFYPTNTLVTAQEIIFFWVARMIMAGLEFKKEIPFRDVYIHGTVRDDTGAKMSKSLGNIIDPLEIINEFGADALRFSIISITAQGQDVFLSKDKFNIGRNFANKIWNASRFIIMNLSEDKIKVDLCVFFKNEKLPLADKWILSRLYSTIDNVTKALDSYKINEAANAVYEFFWHDFCDWYIEISKSSIESPQTQVILYKVLEKSLRILHPFVPFVTEAIWQSLPRESESIMVSDWPHMQRHMISKEAEGDMRFIIDLIVAIRNIRAAWNIQPNVEVNISIKTDKKDTAGMFKENAGIVKRLAKVKDVEFRQASYKPRHAAASVVSRAEIFVHLEGAIDIQKETGRLNKEIEKLSADLAGIEKRLKNKEFVKKAPVEVVEAQKVRKAELRETIEKLKGNLRNL